MSQPVSPTRRSSFFSRLGLPQTPPPWGLVEVVTLLVVIALAMLIIASGIAVAISPSPDLISPVSLAVGWGAGALLIVGYVLLTRRRTAEDWQALRLGSGQMALALVLLMGIAIGVTVDILAGLATGTIGRSAELRNLNLTDPAQIVIGMVLVALLLPLAHGLAFTGVMLPVLRTRLGAWPGILTTSLLFSVYFFLTFGSTLTGSDRLWHGGFVPLATMLCLCAVRVSSGSTRTAIIAAMGVGLIGALLALLIG